MFSKTPKFSVLAIVLFFGLSGAAIAQTAATTNTTAAPGAATVAPAPRNDDRGFDWGGLASSDCLAWAA